MFKRVFHAAAPITKTSWSRLFKATKLHNTQAFKQVQRSVKHFSNNNSRPQKKGGLSIVELALIATVLGGLGYQFFKYETTISSNTREQTFGDQIQASFKSLLQKMQLTPATFSILAINSAMFLLCKAKPQLLERLMLSVPNTLMSKRYYTLMSSAFLHSELWHFGLNMYALYMFKNLEFEMGSGPFLALYLISGAFSSGLSLMMKLFTKSMIPSLGASGCIYGTMVAYMFEHPNSQFAIIFLPFFTFNASTLVPCILAFDVAGLLIPRLRTGFDHAGHIGGAVGGALMYYLLSTMLIKNTGNSKTAQRTITYTNGNETYTGQVTGFNLKNGFGELKIGTDFKYEGNFVNGYPHGAGKRWSKNNFIQGEFEQGKFVRGKMVTGQDYYEGEFENLKLVKGKRIVNKNTILNGTFDANQLLHGPNCQITWVAQHMSYVGNVEHGKPVGAGTLVMEDGSKFVSDSFGKSIVTGTLYQANGSKSAHTVTME